MSGLVVEDLRATVHDTEILQGLDLRVPFGEIHAVMGPNGSGKSTLCHVLTGHPAYDVDGRASVDGDDLLSLDVDGRARLGLLQAFQYPVEVPGVTLAELMAEALEERDQGDDTDRIGEQAARFDMGRFLDRSVNDDLSGGEKKRSEIFQLSLLEPRVALLDEIDSGLDIDAVRSVAEAVEEMRRPDVAIVMITHYSRILQYLTPDAVHVMIGGRIVTSGGPELADELEAGGYDAIRARLGLVDEPSDAPERRPSDFLTDTPFD